MVREIGSKITREVYPREAKIGPRNRRLEKSGVKLQRGISKKSENWFEKSGVKLQGSISKGNENWFEKSGVKLRGSISKGNESWFEKLGVKYSDANPWKSFGSRYREV